MGNGNLSSKAVQWFAIKLPISYEGPEGSLLQGNGRTLAMSSVAIQFACDRHLPVGQIFRLRIQWPATLCDGTSLSLWAMRIPVNWSTDSGGSGPASEMLAQI